MTYNIHRINNGTPNSQDCPRNRNEDMANRRSNSPNCVRSRFHMENSDKGLLQLNNLNIDLVKETDVDTQEDRIASLKRQIEQTQQRLQIVQTQRERDQKTMRERLVQEKASARQQLRSKYPHLFAGSNINERRQEIQKIIRYLKGDNSRIRNEIQHHHTMIQDLKTENARLEKTNENVQAILAELRQYIQSAEEKQERLIKTTNVLKSTLKTVNLDLLECDAYSTHEANFAYKYEHYIGNLVRQLEQKNRHGRYRGLFEGITSLVIAQEDGMDEATTSRLQDLEHIDATNKTLTRRQRKSLQILKKQTKKLKRRVRDSATF
mmetsp:Transcript_5904/g.14012  ORF Transcript_5904/g.14012 Transcript_5904/m.14012 type:complete len:322 (+) Transcript_5904:989-1954(+)